MLRLVWDSETKTYVDKSAFVKIRTGQSQAYKNILAGLAVRDAGRAARIRLEMGELLNKISEQGGTALLSPNIPEIYVVKFDPYEAVIMNGIVFTGMSPGGRLEGTFSLVIITLDEADEALTEVFKLERYIQAALIDLD